MNFSKNDKTVIVNTKLKTYDDVVEETSEQQKFAFSHPGSVLFDVFIEPLGLTHTEVAEALDVSTSSLSRIITGSSGISSDMAVRISHVFGGSPEAWASLQSQYDIEKSKAKVDVSQLRVLNPVSTTTADEQESINFEPCNRFSVLIYESFNTNDARLNEYNYYTARNDLHTFEERLAHVCEVFNVDEANVYGITLCPNEELSGEETHEYAITMRDGTSFIHGVCYLFDFKSSLDEYMKEELSFMNPDIELDDIVSIERVL